MISIESAHNIKYFAQVFAIRMWGTKLLGDLYGRSGITCESAPKNTDGADERDNSPPFLLVVVFGML